MEYCCNWRIPDSGHIKLLLYFEVISTLSPEEFEGFSFIFKGSFLDGIQIFSSLFRSTIKFMRQERNNTKTLIFAILIKYILRSELNMFKMRWARCSLSEPISHSTFWSRSIVINSWWIIFRSWWEEFNCRITIYTEPWGCFFILGSINLSNLNFAFHSCS